MRPVVQGNRKDGEHSNPPPERSMRSRDIGGIGTCVHDEESAHIPSASAPPNPNATDKPPPNRRRVLLLRVTCRRGTADRGEWSEGEWS